MDLVDDLVLTPFKEIVEKAATAVGNAGDYADMQRASQALLKEGQRALKRIEPVCRKQFEEHGTAFTDALKENDELARYRTELNDFLWEFDDFLEPNDFDPEQFAELQKLSRKAAPRVYDIVMRMKLDARDDRPVSSVSGDSSRSSPAKARPATLAAAPMRAGRSPLTPLALTPPPGPAPRRSLPPTPVEGEPAEFPVPPVPPGVNPWDPRTKPGAVRAPVLPERRRPAAPTQADLAILPQLDVQAVHDAQQNRRLSAASPPPLDPRFSASSPPPFDPRFSASSPPPHDPRLSPPASSPPLTESPTLGTVVPALPAPPMHARPRVSGFPPSAHRQLDHAIPEHATVDGGSSRTTSSQYDRYSAATSHTSRRHSNDSYRSSVHGASSSGEYRGSGVSGHESSVGSPVFSQGPAPGTPASRDSTSPHDSAGLQAVAECEAEGLIAVEAEERSKKPLPPRDTSITMNSSFYLMKGFCDGAKEVMAGELGVKKVKKPTFSGSQLTAKCTQCFYELDWREIEMDINQSNEANFAIGNIGFRIRFLQKSHIPTRRADEPMYGCVFCIHEGHTSQDGDATVFFSQRELCEHIARHPRPLPHVPGITVVDEPQMPLMSAASYDVHLRSPVQPSASDGKWGEIAMLPTVTAKETVRKMYGMRLLHDRTPAFELAIGAKLVGVEFPDKYNGEWCMGYHEGKYASFPYETVRFVPPPPHELILGGTSSTTAVARWKFVVKEKDKSKAAKTEWLKFDKGDMIKNICWSDPDHWCYSGTNQKGKWGIFPKSHLDMATLREGNADSDRSSTLSGAPSVKPKSLLGRMTSGSSRRSDERVPDVPPLPDVTAAPPAAPRKYTPLPSYYHLTMYQ